jgi:ribosome-associated toxin RatA of RatAB toxin-antitoxin module
MQTSAEFVVPGVRCGKMSAPLAGGKRSRDSDAAERNLQWARPTPRLLLMLTEYSVAAPCLKQREPHCRRSRLLGTMRNPGPPRAAACAGTCGTAVSRSASALLVVLALALPWPAVAGATITVDAQRHGNAVDIRATAVLTADAGTAWRVITDYDRYPEFIPGLRSSHVIARHGSMATVEQAGDVSLWPFRFPVDVTYEIHEMPPGNLESKAVGGNLRALASSYVLTPADSGTRLDYSGHADLGSALFREFERVALERAVARQFRALADEIERRGGAARSNAYAGEK